MPVLHLVKEISPFQGKNYVCSVCSCAYYVNQYDMFTSEEEHFTEEMAEAYGLRLCDGTPRDKD